MEMLPSGPGHAHPAVAQARSSSRRRGRPGHRRRPGAAREGTTRRGAASVVGRPSDAAGLYELVTDWVGGAALAAALTKVAPGGTVVVGSGNQDKTPINIYDFFGHEGARLVSYLSYAYPEPPGPDLAILAGLVSARRLDPVLGLVEAWTRLPEAIQALTERRITGKAVLTIGQAAAGHRAGGKDASQLSRTDAADSSSAR